MAENPYLEFVTVNSPTGKTKVVWIRSKSTGLHLGYIKWYGPWRQYCFYPEPDTIWNPECMEAVRERIGLLMADRKAMRESGNP